MRIEAGGMVLDVDTDYPDAGVVTVTVVEAPPTPRTLTFRIPEWATGPESVHRRVFTAGATLPRGVRGRGFPAGELLGLELPMRPRWTFPDPRVDALRGCAAVEVGPIVM